jgi:glycine cleavage system H protein
MSELKFTETHEWIRVEDDDVAIVGITDYAQGELGDVVYVALPEVDAMLYKEDGAVVVESVKSAVEIKMPITGKVSAINESLSEQPELVNMDPEGDGWLFVISGIRKEELDSLMDKGAYEEFLSDL